MATEHEYINKIKGYQDYDSLLTLWNQKREDKIDPNEWASGKLFEYIILRAFELEGAEVTYPYFVYYHEEIVEQIDGAIRIGNQVMLVECKDYSDNRKINIDPLAKLRNQLLRRHASVFGMFFSASGYTEPVEDLVKFMGPQMIILWTMEDIDYCMENHCFVNCFYAKYKYAVEQCEYNFKFGAFEMMEELKNGK